jgi:putative toxin-antitoxin system antitoxin component (TIGR02293 family)
MAPPQSRHVEPEAAHVRSRNRSAGRGRSAKKVESIAERINLAFEAQKGISKTEATRLFQRVANASPLPLGKLRAELIPDSSWKRAGKTLGQQASQAAARLSSVLSLAERVWGNEADATEWLNSPHPELRGETPLSLLRTEAGGRAVEALLGALEFGFPV